MSKQTTPRRTYSGQEIGRKMIEDLVASFQHAKNGTESTGVLSDQEKAALVNGLLKPEDIRQYNEFRYIHEYLVHVPDTFELCELAADASSFRLLSMLTNLSISEHENAVERHIPRIMTQKQYDDLSRSDSLNAPYGLAIIKHETSVENIDENGHYHIPTTFWRRHYLAENFLQNNRPTIHLLLNKYSTAIQKGFAVETALQLISEFIGVLGLSILIGKVDTSRVETINSLMKDIPNHIYRYGLYPDELPEDTLRDQLRELLQPIDVETLKPTQKAVAKARKTLSFTTFQGNINQFYAILLNGGDKA